MYIGKEVLNCHLGSSPGPCYIQNRVIMNRVIKRFRCTCNKQIIYIVSQIGFDISAFIHHAPHLNTFFIDRAPVSQETGFETWSEC